MALLECCPIISIQTLSLHHSRGTDALYSRVKARETLSFGDTVVWCAARRSLATAQSQQRVQQAHVTHRGGASFSLVAHIRVVKRAPLRSPPSNAVLFAVILVVYWRLTIVVFFVVVVVVFLVLVLILTINVPYRFVL